MNRKISLMLVLVLAITVVFTGCSPEAVSYMKETQRVQNWEAVDMNGKVDFNMEIINPENPEETVEISMPMEMESHIVGNTKGKMKFTYDMSGFKALAPEGEGEEIPEELELEMFITEDMAILPKDFFTQLGGEIDEEVFEGEEKYIGLEFGEEMLMGASNLKEYQNLLEKFEEDFFNVFEKYESDIEIKQEGNKYSYDVGIDEVVEEMKNVINFIKENREEVFELFEPVIVENADEDEEEVKAALEEMKAELDTLEISELDELPVEALKDSRISGVIEFGEDEMKQDVKMVLNVEDFIKISFDMDFISKKVEPRELDIPTDVKAFDMDELMDNIISVEVTPAERLVVVLLDDEPIEFDSMPIIEDGRTLVPCRKIFEVFDAEVEWDDDEEVVTINKDDEEIVLTIGSNIALVNGEEVELDKAPRVEEDRTLVPLRFISENLGLRVEFDMNEYAFIVSLYTE